MRTVLLLCLASLCLPAAAAELYKWTDEKGRVQYSDRPPPQGVQAERWDLPQEADSPARQESPAPPPSPQCEQARHSLAQLVQNTHVAMDLDGDGKAETLDETTRQAQIVAMQGRVDQLCAPPKPRRPSPEAGAPPAQGEGSEAPPEN